MATFVTWKKRGEEASLEGGSALWSEGSASLPGRALGDLFSWGPAKQPAPQPCQCCCRRRGGSVGSCGVKDRAVLAVGWCGCSFMVRALWWQCSPLHPWLLVPASGTERTSPRGDTTARGTLRQAGLRLKQTQN